MLLQNQSQKISIQTKLRQNLISIAASLSAAIFLSSCGGDEDKKPTTEKLSSWSEAVGTWVPQGLGLAYDVSKSGEARLYGFTQKTCLPILKGTIADLDKEFINLELDRSNEITLLKASEKFDTSPYRKVTFEKQDLPQVCNDAQKVTEFNPELLFDHIYYSFLDYHAFFDLYHVDWASLYDRYAAQVNPNTTEQQLFSIISEMLEPIDDGHTSIRYQDNFFSGEKPAGFTKTASQIFFSSFFNCLSEGAEQQDCAGGSSSRLSIMAEFTSVLETHYATEQLEFFGFDGYQIGHTILKNNIGYIQLNQMLGYSAPLLEILDSGDFTFDEEINVASTILDTILSDLAGTDGIIIDIRINTGGSDPLALAIAERFTAERTKAFEKQRYVKGEWRALEATYLDPHSGITYSNPVVLITGPETGSGAEIFSLAMRALPQVTHIGEPSSGDLSDRYEVFFPENWSDWQVTYANERYIDNEGNIFEAIGVLPEIFVPVTSYMSTKMALLPAIDKAFDLLNANPITLNKTSFTNSVQEVMTATGIPGFAAAIVSKDQILATEALGFADLENQIAVTADTPFNLGSVSKAVLGTAITKAVEDNILSLDLILKESNLPFSVDHPHDGQNPLTLRHLVTHTSSILDPNQALICMYYLREDNSSFANQYIDGVDYCPSPAIINQAQFISELVDKDGTFYNEGMFLSLSSDLDNPTPPGFVYIYSNLGASLASEVLVSEAGQSFDSYTQQYLFNPLEMTNSYWHKPDDAIEPGWAKRYFLSEDGPIEMPDFGISLWSTGQLQSSANDMATFLRMIAKNGEYNGSQILASESVERMLAPQAAQGGELHQDSPVGHMGILWNNDNHVFSHDGSDIGSNAQLFYDIENDLGIILMINASAEDDANFAATFELLTQLTTMYGKYLKIESQ